MRDLSGCFSYDIGMKKKAFNTIKTPDLSRLDAAQLRAMVEQMQQQMTETIELKDRQISQQKKDLHEAEKRIALLEEIVRLRMIQKFAASSEKNSLQFHLFDEAELEAEIEDLLNQAAGDEYESDELTPELQQARDEQKARKKTRNRAFTKELRRKRVELTLSDEEKQGCSKTFFTKVKEELDYVPAHLLVIEYWQEKAVFDNDGAELIIAASRPIHPLGKCTASLSLITQAIISKYVDGLPLHRQEAIFKRLGHVMYRGTMAR